jgi:hypothetical protein
MGSRLTAPAAAEAARRLRRVGNEDLVAMTSLLGLACGYVFGEAFEEPDHRHRRLLRARRERPGKRRAAEKGDERAPPHAGSIARRLKWWQGAVFKWGVLAAGIVIGVYWQQFFARYLLLLIIIAVVSLAYVTYVWWKQ